MTTLGCSGSSKRAQRDYMREFDPMRLQPSEILIVFSQQIQATDWAFGARSSIGLAISLSCSLRKYCRRPFGDNDDERTDKHSNSNNTMDAPLGSMLLQRLARPPPTNCFPELLFACLLALSRLVCVCRIELYTFRLKSKRTPLGHVVMVL